jgi:hypothetical protein
MMIEFHASELFNELAQFLFGAWNMHEFRKSTITILI